VSRKLVISILAAFALATVACARPPSPMMGTIFLDVTDSKAIMENVGSKTGKACINSILGWVTQGDAGIKAAAKAGGITRIQSVDYYSNSLLGIVGEYCTVAYGN